MDDLIAPLVIVVLGSLVPALVAYLRGSNRKARATARILQIEHDKRDENLLDYRIVVRRHNDMYHPDSSEDRCPLPALPPHLDLDTLQGLIEDDTP